ncbi:MAG: hypothetical protein H7Y42_13980 [Chitinophagaceae bacterium]|nr:hypothetical protein [Chitinophagaceae bacterium]
MAQNSNSPFIPKWKKFLLSLRRLIKGIVSKTDRWAILISLAAFFYTVISNMNNERSTNEAITEAKKLADANVESLNEQVKQFKLANRPFLQVQANFLDTAGIDGWPRRIEYKLLNLGKFPVKLLTRSISYTTHPFDTLYFRPSLIGGADSLHLYITNESGLYNTPTIFNYYPRMPKVHESVNNLFKYKLFLYFLGFCDYENLIDGQVYRYEFIMRIDKGNVFFLHNESKIKNYPQNDTAFYFTTPFLNLKRQ